MDRKQRLRRGPLTAVGMADGRSRARGLRRHRQEQPSELAAPGGSGGAQIINLMSPFFWIAVIIGAGVTGMTIFVAIRFRERPGEERNPVQTHGNPVLEVSWTIVPFLILAVMAVPTVATIFNLAKVPKGPDVVHITVEGRQWFWQYQYTDKDTSFYTANEMHIPIDRPVFLTLTSNNVIHSFWVPELAGKKDVVPGHPNTLTIEASRPGTFLGQCAEYCGISHANMRLRVVAQTADDYDKWVAKQKAPLPKATSRPVHRPSRRSGAARRATRSRTVPTTSGRPSARTSRASATASAFAGRDLPDEARRAHEVDPQRARAASRTATSSAGCPTSQASDMTTADADKIAKFLLCDTATDPSSHPECR